MAKVKALLVIAGGRALPNALVLIHVKPEVVIYTTSYEGWKWQDSYEKFAREFPTCTKVEHWREVNAYNLQSGRKACEEILDYYKEKDWEWTIDVSSAPKITGFAAHDVARARDIQCFYIDTIHSQAICLQQEIAHSFSGNLFHLKVSDYMRIYRREHKDKDLLFRQRVEKWDEASKELAHSLDTSDFSKHMGNKSAGVYIPLPEKLACSTLVESLMEQHKLITLRQQDGQYMCAFKTDDAAKFLKGKWLELYAWHEVRRANFAHDYQWGYDITDGKAGNELDLVLTYNARLIICECKTDDNPTKGKRVYLDSLDTKANLLGGLYVTKIFITNQSKNKNKRSFHSFHEQAKRRSIFIITHEDLPQWGEILKKQADKPEYSLV